ncbi:MAG TPA: GNAT family N-acetyltransferase [Tepidiformaceae bacterium]
MNAGVPSVRRIRADEGRFLYEIRLRALADSPLAFGSTLAATSAIPTAVWAERARVSAAGEERVMFVAEIADEWVGLAGGFFDEAQPGDPEVVSMWVDPRWRRSGLAGRLLDAVIGWAHFRGAAQIHLWVTEGNEPAIALYERFGFAFTGESAPLPSAPALTELRMERSSTLSGE